MSPGVFEAPPRRLEASKPQRLEKS